MDAGSLEHVERLTPFRLALFGAGAIFGLSGALLWGADLREQRRLQWSEQITWDTYRREELGRNMMRAHLEEAIDVPAAEERAIAQAGLDRPRQQPPPPEPRDIRFSPGLTSTAAFLAAIASLFGANAIRRTQLAEIQAVADAVRLRREQKEKAAARAAAATQPVMSDTAPPPPDIG